MPNPKPLALAHQCQLCPIPFTAPFADGIEEFKLSSIKILCFLLIQSLINKQFQDKLSNIFLDIFELPIEFCATREIVWIFPVTTYPK